MKTVYIVLLIWLSAAQWEFLEEDLMDFSVSGSKWNYRGSCDWNNGNLGGSGSASG
jgi:hypothetical protein